MAHTQLSTSTKVSVGIAAVALVGLGAYGFAVLLQDESAFRTDTLRPSPQQVALDACLNKCVDASNGCLSNPSMKPDVCAARQTACEAACHVEFSTAVVPPVVTPPSTVAPRVYEIQTVTVPPAWVNKGYSFQLQVKNVPEGADVHWSIDAGRLPEGVKLGDRDGVLAGIPTEAGSFAIRVKVQSPEGSGIEDLVLPVNPDAGIAPRGTIPPTITLPTTLDVSRSALVPASVVISTGSSLPEARIGRSYRLVFATGALPFPTSPVLWSLESGRFPEGVKLGDRDGVLAGIPTEAGRFTVRVRADNGTSYGIKEMVFTVLPDETIAPPVVPPPAPPVSGQRPITISTPSLSEGVMGQPYRAQLSYGTLPFPASPVQWSIVAGRLPDGVKLGDRDGVIAGISNEAGNFHITVRLDNTYNARGEREFDLLMRPPAVAVTPPVVSPPPVVPPVEIPPVNQPPVTGPTSLSVTPDVLPIGTVGQPYSQQLQVASGAPLIWHVVAGTLPQGLTFDEARGVISGTPTEVGQTLLSFRGSDSRTPASETVYGARQYVLTVEAGRPALAIAAASPFPDGTIGVDYQHQPVVASGGSQPYIWRIESGRLPDGLTLNKANGTVSGRPEEAGVFALTIRINDAAQGSVSKDFSLRVSLTEVKPVVDVTKPPVEPGATITPLVLAYINPMPNGTVGDSYNFHPMDVSGGRAPYRWTVSSQNSQLPSGLSVDVNGTIVGVPTNAQVYSFVLRAEDADGRTLSGSFTITINPRAQYSQIYTRDPQWPMRINRVNDMGLRVHDLVKLVDDGDPNTQYDSTVYYIGADGRRHAFPNAKVYFTWFSDYSGVRVILPRQIANIPLGPNLTYRPGVRLVKFVTDAHVYAVDTQRRLRWVTSERAAQELYGTNWNQNVDDISDAFYMDYRFDASPISSRYQFDPDIARRSVGYPSEILP